MGQHSHNQLISLPNNIGNLSSLTSLSFYHNSITSLPSSICDLTDTLEQLNMCGNNLCQDDYELCNWWAIDWWNWSDGNCPQECQD